MSGITSCQICETKHDNCVLAALIQSSFPGVPSTFQKVIRSGAASQDEVGRDVTQRSQR